MRTKKAEPENGEWMLARADSAGCTHGFLDALRDRGLAGAFDRLGSLVLRT